MHKYTKYIPLGLFLLFSLKSLFVGLTYESCLGILILGSIASFFEYKVNEKRIEELSLEIKELGKKIEERSEDLNDIKTHIASVKLGSQLRSASR